MSLRLTARSLLMYGWPILLFAGLFLGRYLDLPGGSAGAKLYKLHCASCHMEEGKGLQKLIPGLAESEYVRQHQGAEMACLIRYGIADSVKKGLGPSMPTNDQLHGVEMASLITYINTHWGNSGKPVSVQEVEQALQDCEN